MNAPASASSPVRLVTAEAAELTAYLEHGGWGLGEADERGSIRYQFLLHALDQGEHHQFILWPRRRPRGLLYSGRLGVLLVAGQPDAAGALAEVFGRQRWRVLIGDEELSQALLRRDAQGPFRRRPSVRRQRLLSVTRLDELAAAWPPGLRLARPADLAQLVEFACGLHVEDRMGSSVRRAARAALAARLQRAVAEREVFVVSDGDRLIAKAELSLRSARRGAQISGVYVAAPARGKGVARGLVANVAHELLSAGVPSVTLHVRADNDAALAAYAAAGFRDTGVPALALH